MPQAWPFGRVLMENVLDGKADTQVQAVWAYLADGAKAAIPPGMIVGKMELKPLKEAIIYRNFITSLSPRGIAVGTPQKAHYAWDATDMSLALIWQGAFIDAAKHWTGRGQGTQEPLGDNRFSLVRGVPFARLDDRGQVWPDQNEALRFQGYRLDKKGIPTFKYTLPGGAEVVDKTVGVQTDELPELHRVARVVVQKDDLSRWYFRAAAAESVKLLDDGSYLVDDALEMTFPGANRDAFVRQANGRKELLVPLKASSEGRIQVEQRIRW